MVNILSAPISDNRSVTPPGCLWGPMRRENVGLEQNPLASNVYMNYHSIVRPVMFMDYGGYVLNSPQLFGPGHFEEMGRGLMLGAMDMWCVGPWSRLSTNPCGDLVKYKAGTHRSLRSLNTGFNFGSAKPVSSKYVVMQSRVRLSEMGNLKVRKWELDSVGNCCVTPLKLLFCFGRCPSSNALAPRAIPDLQHGHARYELEPPPIGAPPPHLAQEAW